MSSRIQRADRRETRTRKFRVRRPPIGTIPVSRIQDTAALRGPEIPSGDFAGRGGTTDTVSIALDLAIPALLIYNGRNKSRPCHGSPY